MAWTLCMTGPNFRLVVIALPMALSACASAGGDYPSLAIRSAERVSGSGQPVTPEPVALPAPPLDTATGQRIDLAVARARKAHASFRSAIGGASGTIAAARGSQAPADAWTAAQIALADLQSLRSDGVIAQADLDQIYAEERMADPARLTPTAQALLGARETVDAWVEEQDRAIARLASQLRD